MDMKIWSNLECLLAPWTEWCYQKGSSADNRRSCQATQNKFQAQKERVMQDWIDNEMWNPHKGLQGPHELWISAVFGASLPFMLLPIREKSCSSICMPKIRRECVAERGAVTCLCRFWGRSMPSSSSTSLYCPVLLLCYQWKPFNAVRSMYETENELRASRLPSYRMPNTDILLGWQQALLCSSKGMARRAKPWRRPSASVRIQRFFSPLDNLS